ncbi:MAG TPA: UDP-N-acetylmuramate dehydrogenase [Candidatus Paceibacterota bacterium]|nr:UDP-N-acetylmuramate dehydrogenase [Candidatus Paceibacterota bacterium]
MVIQENVDIKGYSTFKIGGKFKYFTEVENINDIKEVVLFGKEKNTPLFILGGGSNIIFSDGDLNILAVKMEIKGFEIIKDTNEYTDIKIGAGENWDKIVEKTVFMNLCGFEALSAIPGTVGATPIQNVGAYGAEVKDTILEVEAFNVKPASHPSQGNAGGDNKIEILSNEDCKFEYRDSIFKHEAKGKYIIISVTYRLYKKRPTIPDYPGVKKYFIENNINNPSLNDIREAIIYIRNEKLPNPKDIPNVGSFFKNPIVDNSVASSLKKKFSNAKFFKVDEYLTKIPAGWLIENAGLKGKSFGKVSIYDKNALVLVNKENATCADVISARDEIIKIVKEKFGITLEQEPEII